MSQYTYATTALILAITAGCSPRDRRDTASSADSVSADVSRETREAGRDVKEAGRDVKEAARDVREEVGDYTYARRAEFRKDMDQRIQRLDQELAELERTTKKGVDKARDSAIVNTRALRRSVDRSLERVRAATAATWADVQAGVGRSVDSLEFALRNLRSDARPMGGAGPS
jgi:polyhydroxyalkanoate synthesis regulator phasin